jgi:hypothetical protein
MTAIHLRARETFEVGTRWALSCHNRKFGGSPGALRSGPQRLEGEKELLEKIAAPAEERALEAAE